MGGFNDRMFMGDGVEMKLSCGHPYVKPGEKCPLCGNFVPQEENKDEVRK